MNHATVSVRADGLLTLPLPKKWAGRRFRVNQQKDSLSLIPIDDPNVADFFEAVSESKTGKTLSYESMQDLINDNERHAQNKANS
jgi:hypothetical protein